MNKILEKKQLSETVFGMTIEAPLIANERKAGQFIILMVDEDAGERIPLTIADADKERGTISLIFQAVGATTIKLSKMNVGDSLPAVLGPLGKPTDIRGENGEKPGHVVCVGGGIGVAPLHSIAQALKAAGNRVTIIIGARSKNLFILEEEMRKIGGIIDSMTPEERRRPDIIDLRRKKRIAAGCGMKIEDVNRLLKQFDQMQQMMKRFSAPGAMKKMKRSGFKFPY